MQQHVGPQQSFVHWQRKRREVFKGLGDNEATTARPEQRLGLGFGRFLSLNQLQTIMSLNPGNKLTERCEEKGRKCFFKG